MANGHWLKSLLTLINAAAGGRYDQLIKSQIPGRQPKSIQDPRAVGFSFNWERLCTSMMRYMKANVKAKTKKRTDAEVPIFRTPRRCEVLVDSSDREVLHSTGIDLIQGLWYASPAKQFLSCLRKFVRGSLLPLRP